jgi:hypothetical protein
MSSPGPTVADFDRFSSSERDDSPLYTPVLPTSPALHGLPSGFQMLTLPEAFECGMSVGGAQVRFCPSPFFVAYLHSIRIPRRPSVPHHQGLTRTVPTRVPINTSNSRLPTATYTPLRWSS